jgi:leucyl aminopeptidase (aminopeptidase T)
MALQKLEKACNIALKDYMGLSPEETLLVVCDEQRRDIGLAIFEQGKALGKEAFYVEMKARELNGEEPPEAISELMMQVDVVVCPTTKSLTHTKARREASNSGIRVGTMPGITSEIMARCFSADYTKIIETTELVADKLRTASRVRVETKAGTDLTIPMKRRKVLTSTGVLRNIGESGNLPSGEVYLAPWEDKTNGILVVDGSVAGIGLVNDPIYIEIVDGYAEKITGKEEAQKLIQMLDSVGRDARAVAEFGFGTNYKAKICGQILEDEKVLGTIHIAFGNNLTMGGKINVPIHIDAIVKKPTVNFDDEVIMDKGRLLI